MEAINRFTVPSVLDEMNTYQYCVFRNTNPNFKHFVSENIQYKKEINMVAADERKCDECGKMFWTGYVDGPWAKILTLPEIERYKHKKCESCRPKEECENTVNNSPVV